MLNSLEKNNNTFDIAFNNFLRKIKKRKETNDYLITLISKRLRVTIFSIFT